MIADDDLDEPLAEAFWALVADCLAPDGVGRRFFRATVSRRRPR